MVINTKLFRKLPQENIGERQLKIDIRYINLLDLLIQQITVSNCQRRCQAYTTFWPIFNLHLPLSTSGRPGGQPKSAAPPAPNPISAQSPALRFHVPQHVAAPPGPCSFTGFNATDSDRDLSSSASISAPLSLKIHCIFTSSFCQISSLYYFCFIVKF